MFTKRLLQIISYDPTIPGIYWNSQLLPLDFFTLKGYYTFTLNIYRVFINYMHLEVFFPWYHQRSIQPMQEYTAYFIHLDIINIILIITYKHYVAYYVIEWPLDRCYPMRHTRMLLWNIEIWSKPFVYTVPSWESFEGDA